MFLATLAPASARASLVAGKLGVTPGAISQHIRALENWAGVALFERRSQGVRLTADGLCLAPEFEQGFDALGHAVRNLRASAGKHFFQVAALHNSGSCRDCPGSERRCLTRQSQ
ncbi:MAG: hypothetical protein CMM46_17875 [Rhodospirillaceae bacterium]|nr:hypothetical protein [Rhodospirillaceae bacterium]